MKVSALEQAGIFTLVNRGDDPDAEISKPFCCDLLSIAMSKAPAGCAWVTVMGNINTIAVASLTEAAAIILAEGARLDEPAGERAAAQGIYVFATDMPIFEAALAIKELSEKQ